LCVNQILLLRHSVDSIVNQVYMCAPVNADRVCIVFTYSKFLTLIGTDTYNNNFTITYA